MRHVSIRNLIDPTPYLSVLPSFANDLPDGARTFATDPGHYDFSGRRCVKDLKLRRIAFDDHDGALLIEFGHNCWKHEEDLVIQYREVHGLTVDLPGSSEPWHHDVVLDEILPAPAGCSHEVAFHSGTVIVACADLTATWTEVDCPDARVPNGPFRT